MRTAQEKGMHLRRALILVGIVGMLAVLLGMVAVGSAQVMPGTQLSAVEAGPTPTEIPTTWKPPVVNKIATASELRPGDAVQFTIAVKSPNNPPNQKDWYNVVTKDAIDPALRIDSVQVIAEGVHDAVVIGNTVVVTDARMEPGEQYNVYIRCTLVDASEPGPSIVNVATVDLEEEPGKPSPFGTQYAEAVTLTVLHVVDLPLIVRNFPPLLAAPSLNAISNPDGEGSYTVSWSGVSLATEYILQEAKRSDFSDAVQVYRGANTTRAISGRGPTRYYYRVRAGSSTGVSNWSNTRSVDVVWELEPNDDALTQANGPIVSGVTYYGTFPNRATDWKDYFYFDLPVQGPVELWLTNIPAGQDFDLLLYDADLNEVARSDQTGAPSEHILKVVAAGRYYVQAYHWDGNGSTQAYHLKVDYQ
jgi:fimbrial isopeptide formation D2 family protein